jgi:peptidyl-tRNA hydrolase, PTH1 family
VPALESPAIGCIWRDNVVSDPLSSEVHEQTPRIIVGLGNPGKRYAKTRHNVGYMVVDALAGEDGRGGWITEHCSSFCPWELEGRQVLLVKPMTFMNHSGDAVKLFLSERGLGPKDLMLLMDDLNLPLGKIRVRARGSAGGHNGLQSVLRMVESDEVLRVRLGIGEENMPADKSEFVLEDFPPEQIACLGEMIARAGDAVKTILRDGVSKAMAVFNA